MEQLLFHPKVVHLPIALAVLMPLVAVGLATAWWRGWYPRRVWLVAVLFQAMLVVSGFVALRTGEAEEERVEHVVPEHRIEAHEEAAEVFLVAGAVVLGLMAGAGWLPRERAALMLAVLSTVGTLAVLGLGIQVGEAGGSLVYRYGAVGAYVDAAAGRDAAGQGLDLAGERGGEEEGEDDDDD